MSKTGVTGDLSDFLHARIAEDEAVAREAADEGPPPWYWGYGGPQGKYGLLTGSKPHWRTAGALIYGDMDRSPAAHIARWDPARVLAECEAKRRIVKQLWLYIARPDPTSDDPSGTQALWIVKTLAFPYAAHPDFREEWRV